MMYQWQKATSAEGAPMSDKTPEDDVEETPFVDFITEHRHGMLAYEAATEMANAVEAVRLYGKPATLTITLKIEPKGRTVVVLDDVKTKLPRADREAAIYFADDDGQLHKDDPAQQRLPLTEVGMDDGTLRVVSTETGEIREAGNQ